MPTRRCGPGLLLRAEGKDSRNFEQPNLKAQASKLWQKPRTALRRSVPEELSRLSQIVHTPRVETHQAGAYEIGGDGIVGQHDPPKIARRAMQRPVALHADDPVGYDEMRRNSGIDIEDASINALPMQQVLRTPTANRTFWDRTELAGLRAKISTGQATKPPAAGNAPER